jgi:predicted metalloprotease
VSDRVRELREQNPDEANELSIRLELQADCLAGVWGFTARQRGILSPGDLEEGLRAAASVGDDRIQRKATGTTHPESWTHGSGEQRTRWFSRGFQSGNPDSCDTFAGEV